MFLLFFHQNRWSLLDVPPSPRVSPELKRIRLYSQTKETVVGGCDTTKINVTTSTELGGLVGFEMVALTTVCNQTKTAIKQQKKKSPSAIGLLSKC